MPNNNNIPTAEERFQKFFDSFPRYGTRLADDWKKEIIEIADKLAKDKAKHHVRQALTKAAEKAKTKKKEIPYTGARAGGSYFIDVVDTDSILNAYPTNKIK